MGGGEGVQENPLENPWAPSGSTTEFQATVTASY